MKKIFPAITLLLLLVACNETTKTKQTSLSPDEARSLAKEAYLFGAPLVYFEKQFDFISYATKVETTKAPVNQLVHYRQFADASNKSVVGLNVDNLYTNACF